MAALALISMLLPASTSKPVEVVTRPVPMYKVGLASRFLMSTTRRASRAGTIAVTAVVTDTCPVAICVCVTRSSSSASRGTLMAYSFVVASLMNAQAVCRIEEAVALPAVVRLPPSARSHRLHRLHLLAQHLFRPFLVTPLGLGLNRRILLLVLLPQVHHRLKVVGQVVHITGLGFQANLVQPAQILVVRMQAAELALWVQN